MYETEHFKYGAGDNLSCPCCDGKGMSKKFLDKLEKARIKADIPFQITSGYRCKRYQALLKSKGFETATGTSPHEKGVAVDIKIRNGIKRWTVLKALMAVGFNRIGIGSNFMHVDTDKERKKDYMWHYKR